MGFYVASSISTFSSNAVTDFILLLLVVVTFLIRTNGVTLKYNSLTTVLYGVKVIWP